MNGMNYNYPIALKKVKPKNRRRQQVPTYKINEPPSEDLHVGTIAIGKTLSVLPENLSTASVFILSESKIDILVLSTDDEELQINLQIDAPFVSGLLQCGKFYFKFTQSNDDISVDLYFRTLPIERPTKQFRLVVSKLFKLLFGVGDHSPEKVSSKKIIDNLDNVSNVYRAIRAKQHSLGLIEEAIVTGFQQSKWLKPSLRSYQQQAVQWMINKEGKVKEEEEEEMHHPAYVTVKLPSKTVYFDQIFGNISLDRPIVPLTNNGGILADEMGLGKTIEVLALVLSDLGLPNLATVEETTHGNVEITRQRKRPSYVISETNDATNAVNNIRSNNVTREALQLFYNQNVTSVYNNKKTEEPQVACICGSHEIKNLKECVNCKKRQHYNCLGYERNCGIFRCPQCWSAEEPLVSNGTLIICPTSLRQQWLNEIAKHVSCNIKVLNYEGSNVLTPVYPTKLAQYDIVVTTYAVLQTEFRFVDQCAVTSLRHQRKYSSPGSAITLIKWKRLCLDEAQTVENTGTIIAEMAQRLNSTYRWAITGTPISVSISDLYGLIEYLQLSPYNDPAIFKHVLYNKYLDGHQEPLIEFLSTILWRTIKEDVLEQINIPQQTIEYHSVEFTQVEQYFYDCETHESRKIFKEKLQRYDLTTPLISLKKDELTRLLVPIISLRRVCVHHNVVKGRYLLTKKPVNSMQELLDALIARNLNDAEDSLRLIIASLNGLAGLYLLLRNPLTAAKKYVQIRQLESKFTKVRAPEQTKMQYIKLSIDKLPLIHMYHNLRQLLLADEHLSQNLSVQLNETIVMTAEELKTKHDLLELEYILKFEHTTKQVIENLNEISEKIFNLESAMTHETWYADLVMRIFEKKLNKHLAKRITSILENYPRFTFRPEQSFMLTKLITWINAMRTSRELTMAAVNDLFEVTPGNRIVFTQEMVEEVVDCHLRPDKNRRKKKNRDECRFCQSHKLLLEYEKIIFNEKSENEGKQFSWKPSEEDLILKEIVKVAKSKLKSEGEAIRNGVHFLEIVELQKKEFKELRKEWTYLDAQLCAIDEIALCKTRLKMRDANPDQQQTMNRSLQQLSYDIKNNLERINEISEHEVDAYRWNLEHELQNHQTRLEKCIGTNNYLQSLHNREDSGQPLDPCPICRCQLENSWNILRCGHTYCINCLQTIIGRTNHKQKRISCAVCREMQSLNEINYVDTTLAQKSTDEEIDVKGNCSSKVRSIVRLIKILKNDDSDVKILVFSTWLSVLKVFKDVFYQNEIDSELLISGRQVVKSVENFKHRSKGITVLLLPVNLGAKGLNLIEATHVIFAEPILDPSEEQQAIGRVHRIGQEKPTVVHKFIMTGSIEAEIQRVTSAKDNAKWNKTEVTLQQLNDLLFANVAQDREENSADESRDNNTTPIEIILAPSENFNGDESELDVFQSNADELQIDLPSLSVGVDTNSEEDQSIREEMPELSPATDGCDDNLNREQMDYVQSVSGSIHETIDENIMELQSSSESDVQGAVLMELL